MRGIAYNDLFASDRYIVCGLVAGPWSQVGSPEDTRMSIRLDGLMELLSVLYLVADSVEVLGLSMLRHGIMRR